MPQLRDREALCISCLLFLLTTLVTDIWQERLLPSLTLGRRLLLEDTVTLVCRSLLFSSPKKWSAGNVGQRGTCQETAGKTNSKRINQKNMTLWDIRDTYRSRSGWRSTLWLWLVIKPLQDLTKKSIPFVMSETHIGAFNQVKLLCQNYLRNSFIDWDAVKDSGLQGIPISRVMVPEESWSRKNLMYSTAVPVRLYHRSDTTG